MIASITMIILSLSLGASALASPKTDYLNDLEGFQQKSFSVRVEKGRLEAAQDNSLSKKLFWTPDISLSVGKSKTSLNNSIIYDEDYAQANASLNLFKGGADWAAMNQAEAIEKARSLGLKNEEIRSDISGSDLIFKSVYLKESQRIQDEIYKLKEESLRIVKDRYAQGKSPLQEVTKSEVDLSQQKNRVRTASLSILENETAIKSQQILSVKTEIWPFSEREVLNVSSLKETKTEQLPTVEQKYWNLKSGEYAWKAAKRTYWPTVDWSFQYREFPLKERDNHQWTSLVELTIPLWSKYETAAAVSSAYAGYLESEVDFQSAQLAAGLKREFLLSKISAARQNLMDAKGNLEKNRGLYKDLLRSFRLGRLSMNDLFLEQNRLLESESTLADSQLIFHQVVVEACALQGLRIQNCLK